MVLELLSVPLLTILVISLIRSRRAVEIANLAGASAVLLFGLGLVHRVYRRGEVAELGGILRVDALGAFLILVASLLAFAALTYSHAYITQEILHKAVGLARLKRYYLLFYSFLLTVFLVAASDNLGVLWIALEATTLASAGLVALYTTQESLEAAWKYIIICSVGISLGLFGTVLAYYSSVKILGESSGALNWSSLREIADRLDPRAMKLAFLFIVIGYGTKAGLAPMHTWLPDAHSQAPSPVSAMLSGIVLSCAMYGILRFYIIAAASLGPDYPAMLLRIFGLASLGIAALFLIIQKDYKRMLAYSSVEHMGIIAAGLAIGGNLGTYGALLHLFNNAMTKSMMFLASGNILLRFRTKEIEKVNGVIRVMPVTGTVFLLGALALTGSPPFSLFISEFTILTAGFSGGAVFASLFMLAALVLSFGGIMFHVNRIVFGPAPGGVDRGEVSLWATGPLLIQMFFVALLGVYIPPFLNEMIVRAVHIIAGGNA